MVVFKILEGFMLLFLVMVVECFLVEDVIIIGCINCDEFVMGFINEIFVYGFICNVVDFEWVFGGFFGVVVVVVQVDICLVVLGSDMGGLVC